MLGLDRDTRKTYKFDREFMFIPLEDPGAGNHSKRPCSFTAPDVIIGDVYPNNLIETRLNSIQALKFAKQN